MNKDNFNKIIRIQGWLKNVFEEAIEDGCRCTTDFENWLNALDGPEDPTTFIVAGIHVILNNNLADFTPETFEIAVKNYTRRNDRQQFAQLEGRSTRANR